MTDEVKKLVDDFVEGKRAFKKKYWYESSVYAAAASMIFVSHGKTLDIEKMKEARKIVNKKFGVFSNFRDTMKIFTVANIALDDDMQNRVTKVTQAYSALKGKYSAIWHGDYLPMAAFTIADNSSEGTYDEVAERTRNIYDLIRKDHPLLTSSSDIPFLALLGISKLTDEEISERTKKSFAILKKKFPFNKEGVQQLGFIETLLGGDVEKTSEKIIEIRKAMKKNKVRFGSSYEAPVLAILASLDKTPEEIAKDVAEVDMYMKKLKKMNVWYIPTQQRRMYSSVLYAMDSLSDDKTAMAAVAASTSTITQIIIEEIILMCVVMSTCTAVSSSSSSSSN